MIRWQFLFLCKTTTHRNLSTVVLSPFWTVKHFARSLNGMDMILNMPNSPWGCSWTSRYTGHSSRASINLDSVVAAKQSTHAQKKLDRLLTCIDFMMSMHGCWLTAWCRHNHGRRARDSPSCFCKQKELYYAQRVTRRSSSRLKDFIRLRT
jgi:hypothetical protein